MAKPLGVELAVSDGALHLRVTPIDRVADRVWDAVGEAIAANMTPERFKAEAAEAWEHHLKEAATYAKGILTK